MLSGGLIGNDSLRLSWPYMAPYDRLSKITRMQVAVDGGRIAGRIACQEAAQGDLALMYPAQIQLRWRTEGGTRDMADPTTASPPRISIGCIT